MDIKQLKTFMVVAECGSFSRASEKLRIAQPALSRQIKLLEDFVGTAVFERHARGVWLTEAGKELLERVSGPIVQLEKSVLDVKSLNSEIHGSVTLGVLPTLFDLLPVSILLRVQKELPGVRLIIREAYSVDLLEFLTDGSVDLAFLYGPTTNYSLKSIGLFFEDLVLLSPPKSLPDIGPEIDIRTISELPLALLSRPFGPRLIMDKFARKHNIELQSKFDVDSFNVVLSMIEAGLCHSFMPASSITKLVKEGRIEARLIGPKTPQRQLILGQTITRPCGRAVKAVTNIILKETKHLIENGTLQARPCSDLCLIGV